MTRDDTLPRHADVRADASLFCALPAIDTPLILLCHYRCRRVMLVATTCHYYAITPIRCR